MTARNDALTEAAESKLTATHGWKQQNQTLTDGLAQCRLGQEDLSQRIAMLEAAMEEAADHRRCPRAGQRALHAGTGRIAWMHDVALSWAVEDAATNASLDRR